MRVQHRDRPSRPASVLKFCLSLCPAELDPGVDGTTRCMEEGKKYININTTINSK